MTDTDTINFEDLDFGDDPRIFIGSDEVDVFYLPDGTDHTLDRKVTCNDDGDWVVTSLHDDNPAADVTIQSAGRKPSSVLRAFTTVEEAVHTVLGMPRVFDDVSGDGTRFEVALNATNDGDYLAVQERPGTEDRRWVAFLRDADSPERFYGPTLQDAVNEFFGMEE